MSNVKTDDKAIVEASFAIAWKSFRAFVRLSQNENASAPRKLRQYIDALVVSGQRDSEKIAQSALGLLREYEQIARSRSRIAARETTQ